MERYVVSHEGIQIEAIERRPHGLHFALQRGGIAFQCRRSGATSDFLQGGPDLISVLHLFRAQRYAPIRSLRTAVRRGHFLHAPPIFSPGAAGLARIKESENAVIGLDCSLPS